MVMIKIKKSSRKSPAIDMRQKSHRDLKITHYLCNWYLRGCTENSLFYEGELQFLHKSLEEMAYLVKLEEITEAQPARDGYVL